MNNQHRVAFIIGILSLIILDVCFIKSIFNEKYIFETSFSLYKFFKIDYWYHIGLLGVFITFILLFNGNKGYEDLNKKIDKILDGKILL